jgi:iodotyrosine deiodinase
MGAPILSFDPIPLPDRFDYSETEMLALAEAFHGEMARRHSVRQFSDRPVARAIIEACLKAAGTAPSGANQQPWHFCAVSDPATKHEIRRLAEHEEREFYAGRAGDAWLSALAPIGTDANKPFLDIAPWLIAIFAERKSLQDGRLVKNYYVPESVGIATGFLIAALHHAGLATLTHTPSPMGFLNQVLNRSETEKPYLLLVVGHPAEEASVPRHAKTKKPFEAIASFR